MWRHVTFVVLDAGHIRGDHGFRAPCGPRRTGVGTVRLGSVDWQTRRTASSPTMPQCVTPRETEVLALVRQHLTNAEIADATVRLGAHRRDPRVGAAAQARRRRPQGAGPPRRRRRATLDRRSVASRCRSPLTTFIGRTAERAEARRRHPPPSPGHRHRPRRRRQDAAGARRRGRCRRRLRRRCGVRRSGEGDPARHGGGRRSPTRSRCPSVGDDSSEALVASLADRNCLLVVDNCEHVQDAARSLHRTTAHVVPGRSRPGHQPAATDAAVRARVSLSSACRSARRRRRRDSAVHRADGRGRCRRGRRRPPSSTPFARDLRRARRHGAWRSSWLRPESPSLGLDGAVARARIAPGHPVDVGSRADDRHRSLRAAIDWSYELLDTDERAVLRATAVFAAPFDLDAVRARSSTVAPAVVRRRHWPAWSTGTWCRSTPDRRPATGCWRRSASTPSEPPSRWARARRLHGRPRRMVPGSPRRPVAAHAPGDDAVVRRGRRRARRRPGRAGLGASTTTRRHADAIAIAGLLADVAVPARPSRARPSGATSRRRRWPPTRAIAAVGCAWPPVPQRPATSAATPSTC